MMNRDVSFRRRAIYTGLKPYLADEQLIDAVMHWQQHFAEAPRFTLQKFVSELCREGELRARRADILLSLVQAMNMPGASLLPDPLASSAQQQNQRPAQPGAAFAALMTALFELTPGDNRYQLRLDMLASLDPNRLPQQVFYHVQRWLADNVPIQSLNGDARILRSLVNRAYVMLCERIGPVQADRILAAAVNRACEAHPSLNDEIEALL